MLINKLFLTIILTGVSFLLAEGVDASTLYLSPGSGRVSTGGNITVQVRLNTAGEAVNAVSAFLSYPADKLEVAWIGYGGSAFGIQAESAYGGGGIKISRGNFSGVSGNVGVATISFRGKAEGAATVAFIGGSAAPRASDSSDSLNLGGSAGGTYTVIKGASGGSQGSSAGGSAGTATSTNVAPKISDLKVAEISTNSATISWKTDQLSDSFLEYGLEPEEFILNAGNGNLVTEHSLEVKNPLLTPGLKYYFRVKSKNETEDIVTSGTQTFQLVGYSVKIKVVDDKNQPLPNVEVWLYSDPQKGVTDSQGEVVFQNVSPGKHLAVAKLEGQEKTIEVDVKGVSLSQSIGSLPGQATVSSNLSVSTPGETFNIKMNTPSYLVQFDSQVLKMGGAALLLGVLGAGYLLRKKIFAQKQTADQPPNNGQPV